MSETRVAKFAAALLSAALTASCSYDAQDPPTAPSSLPSFAMAQQSGLEVAMAVQDRHTAALMRIPGVVGTAVTRLANGGPAIQVFVESDAAGATPAVLDGFRVERVVSGRFWIISDPTQFQRPAPLGFSVAHPNVTAGSIGFRVTNGSQVFILSNNHVLANSNNASIGDLTLQPGPADGGSTGNAAHHIGTLADFQTINFGGSSNTMDAAIAVVNSDDLLGSSPTDDGYGAPSATIWGDDDDNGRFDNVGELVGDSVTKYGRTTKLTKGAISSVNATVNVCYAARGPFCTLIATFTDQLIVGGSGFSSGGDSGSGVVTLFGHNPVGLLFAGSTTQTILNRIDLVLNRFGVTVDPGGDLPDPVTDLAVDAVTTTSPATEGTEQNVTVTVKNVGNQTVSTDFNVELRDETAAVTIGNELVTTDLAAGATVNVVFVWTPGGTTGVNHTLEGEHFFADVNGANDIKSTTVFVNAAGGGGSGTTMHVAAMSGSSINNGSTWTAQATITIRDDQNNLLSNATVSGNWSNGTTGSGSCTTNTSGVCTISTSGIAKRTSSVVFTVGNVTHATLTYNSDANITSSVTVSKP